MISERGFTALIEAIYDAGVDFQGWPKALRLMAQAFHALAVLFGCNSPYLEEVFVIAPQVDQIQRERYASYYHRINSIAKHVLPRSSQRRANGYDDDPESGICPNRNLQRFSSSQDFGSMLGAVALVESSRQFSVVAQRRREFERDDVIL